MNCKTCKVEGHDSQGEWELCTQAIKARVDMYEKLCAIHPGGDCLQCKSFANGHRNEVWRLQQKRKEEAQKYSDYLMSHEVRLMALHLTSHQAREALGAIQAEELIGSPRVFDMVIKALGTTQSKGERIVAAMREVCEHARVGDELKVREALLALKKVEEEA